jgi:hypothetical protein
MRSSTSEQNHTQARSHQSLTPTVTECVLVQLEELKAKRQAMVNREADWARKALDTDTAIRELQRKADDFRKQQAAEQLAFQKRQVEEKKDRDAKLAETYANKAAPEYFAQFGTSHR